MKFVSIFAFVCALAAFVSAESEWRAIQHLTPSRISSSKETQPTVPSNLAAFIESRKIQKNETTKKPIVIPVVKPPKRRSDKGPTRLLPVVKGTTEAPSTKIMPSPRKGGIKKKYQKYMLPLLLAYKLKFFALIPLMIGGLVLLAGSTGLAGFFFALFAAVIAVKSTASH